MVSQWNHHLLSPLSHESLPSLYFPTSVLFAWYPPDLSLHLLLQLGTGTWELRIGSSQRRTKQIKHWLFSFFHTLCHYEVPCSTSHFPLPFTAIHRNFLLPLYTFQYRYSKTDNSSRALAFFSLCTLTNCFLFPSSAVRFLSAFELRLGSPTSLGRLLPHLLSSLHQNRQLLWFSRIAFSKQSVLPDHFDFKSRLPWDLAKQITVHAKVNSPELQGCSSTICLTYPGRSRLWESWMVFTVSSKYQDS